MSTARIVITANCVHVMKIIVESIGTNKNMENPLENAIVKVASVENKLIEYKDKQTGEAKSFTAHSIVDTAGVKYDIPETKKDGDETAAWKAIQEHNVAADDVVELAIDMQEYPYKDKKTGEDKTGTRRTVRMLRPSDGDPTVSSTAPKGVSIDVQHIDSIMEDHEKRIKAIEFQLEAKDLLSGEEEKGALDGLL